MASISSSSNPGGDPSHLLGTIERAHPLHAQVDNMVVEKARVDIDVSKVAAEQLALGLELQEAVGDYVEAFQYHAKTFSSQTAFAILLNPFIPGDNKTIDDNGVPIEENGSSHTFGYNEAVRIGAVGLKTILSTVQSGWQIYSFICRAQLLQDAKQQKVLLENQKADLNHSNDPGFVKAKTELDVAIKRLGDYIEQASQALNSSLKGSGISLGLEAFGQTKDWLYLINAISSSASLTTVLPILSYVCIGVDIIKDARGTYKAYHAAEVFKKQETLVTTSSGILKENAEAAARENAKKDRNLRKSTWESKDVEAINALIARRKANYEKRRNGNFKYTADLLEAARGKMDCQNPYTIFTQELGKNGIRVAELITHWGQVDFARRIIKGGTKEQFIRLLNGKNFAGTRSTQVIDWFTSLSDDDYHTLQTEPDYQSRLRFDERLPLKMLAELLQGEKKTLVPYMFNALILSESPYGRNPQDREALIEYLKLRQRKVKVENQILQQPTQKSDHVQEFLKTRIATQQKEINRYSPELGKLLDNSSISIELWLQIARSLENDTFNRNEAVKTVESALGDTTVIMKMANQVTEKRDARVASTKKALKTLEKRKLNQTSPIVKWSLKYIGAILVTESIAAISFVALAIVVGVSNPVTGIPFLCLLGVGAICMGIGLHKYKKYQPHYYAGFWNISLQFNLLRNRWTMANMNEKLTTKKKEAHELVSKYLGNELLYHELQTIKTALDKSPPNPNKKKGLNRIREVVASMGPGKTLSVKALSALNPSLISNDADDGDIKKQLGNLIVGIRGQNSTLQPLLKKKIKEMERFTEKIKHFHNKHIAPYEIQALEAKWADFEEGSWSPDNQSIACRSVEDKRKPVEVPQKDDSIRPVSLSIHSPQPGDSGAELQARVAALPAGVTDDDYDSVANQGYASDSDDEEDDHHVGSVPSVPAAEQRASHRLPSRPELERAVLHGKVEPQVPSSNDAAEELAHHLSQIQVDTEDEEGGIQEMLKRMGVDLHHEDLPKGISKEEAEKRLTQALKQFYTSDENELLALFQKA